MPRTLFIVYSGRDSIKSLFWGECKEESAPHWTGDSSCGNLVLCVELVMRTLRNSVTWVRCDQCHHCPAQCPPDRVIWGTNKSWETIFWTFSKVLCLATPQTISSSSQSSVHWSSFVLIPSRSSSSWILAWRPSQRRFRIFSETFHLVVKHFQTWQRESLTTFWGKIFVQYFFFKLKIPFTEICLSTTTDWCTIQWLYPLLPPSLPALFRENQATWNGKMLQHSAIPRQRWENPLFTIHHTTTSHILKILLRMMRTCKGST